MRATSTDDREVPKRTLLYNVVWGAGWGIRLGLAFATLASIARVAGGENAFAGTGESYPGIVTACMVGGVLGGMVMGALRPFATSALRASLIGVVVSVPPAMANCIATVGWRVNTADLLIALISSVAMGAPGGALFWFHVVPHEHRK